MMEDKICGTCKWRKEELNGWVYTNEASPRRSNWIEYEYTCEEWEEEEWT